MIKDSRFHLLGSERYPCIKIPIVPKEFLLLSSSLLLTFTCPPYNVMTCHRGALLLMPRKAFSIIMIKNLLNFTLINSLISTLFFNNHNNYLCLASQSSRSALGLLPGCECSGPFPRLIAESGSLWTRVHP